jgi:hypothetical protein
VRAYRVRSKYIHGSPSTESPESMQSFTNFVLKLVRMSVVAFLQLETTAPKDLLIHSLDNSLLDETAASRLRRIRTSVEMPR